MVDADGRLDSGRAALAAELASGWLQRVGAGEVLGGQRPEDGADDGADG
jgi:hypothetical protein